LSLSKWANQDESHSDGRELLVRQPTKTVFLDSLDDAAKAFTRLVLLTGGGRSRLTKTLVTFEVSAHSDALEA